MIYEVDVDNSTLREFGTTFRVELPRLSMDHPILLSGLVCAATLHLLSIQQKYEPRFSIANRKHGARVIAGAQKKTSTT
jgi:hypothetical protein